MAHISVCVTGEKRTIRAAESSAVGGKLELTSCACKNLNACACLCVRRGRLHHLDAAGQPELLHQPVDLHSLLQQRVPRAAESAALPVGARPPRLLT